MYTHPLLTAPSSISNYSTGIILIWLGILTIGVIVAFFRFSKRRHTSVPTALDTAPSYKNTQQDEFLLRTQIIAKSLQQSKTALNLTVNAIKEAIENNNATSEEVSKELKAAYNYAIELQRSFSVLLEENNDSNYSNELHIREYNLFDVSDYVLSSFAGVMERNKITLTKNGSSEKQIPIWIDNQKIEFALHNLFGEILHSIGHNGAIQLNVEQQNNNCIVSIGYQSIRHFSDLTFNLVRKIILLHHGSLSLTQHDDTKKTITLTLPLGSVHFNNEKNVRFSHRVSQTTIQTTSNNEITPKQEVIEPPIELDPPQNNPEKSNRNRILIVEDNKDIRTYLKAILSPIYDTLIAENGQEGVDMAKEEVPDLVLCDIMMPVKDGFDCCREIKENVETCHIPVIMLTAKEEDEDIIKGTLMGADDYIIKPFNNEVLKAKISNLIRTRHALKHAYMKLLDIADTESETSEEFPVSEDQAFINYVLETIEKNIQEPDFSAKKLAEIVGMSQSTLYRRIKQYSDFTIIELIRGVRLKRAAALLTDQQYSVQEVVEIVGYNDIPTFRKHFVDLFGVLPSAYASIQSDKVKQ